MTDTRESVGVSPIKSFMETVGGWPLTGDHFDDNAFDWKRITPILLSRSFGPIFDIGVATITINDNKPFISLSVSNLSKIAW